MRELLSGSEPPGAGDFIVVPREDRPYAKGTMVPQLGVLRTFTTAGGVVVPRAAYANEPLKYVQTFLGLDEYFGRWLTERGDGYDNDLWIQALVTDYPREQLVIQLAFLNHTLGQAELFADLMRSFESLLPTRVREFYKAALSSDQDRVFLARQPILRAIREVLLYDGPPDQLLAFPLPMAAVMLAHAFATRLGRLEESGPQLWPTMYASVAMEIIQNYLFNQREDVYPRLDRYARLWDEYGPKVQRAKPRRSPAELLREAIGVDRADLAAVALSLLTRNLSWKPGDTFNFDPYSGIGMDRQTFDTAMQVFTADEAALVMELRGAPADWEMLAFERHPVLRLSNGSVVVLDQEFLLEAVTSSLYWWVLDHELALPADQAAPAADEWSKAYSEMLEAQAEDILRVMAPPLVGNGGKTFYTEEDIEAAYGRGVRRIDAAIDFAPVMALFEVQKGQVSLDTRAVGRVEKFFSDTERMVLDKVTQLQGTAEAVLSNERALTGTPPVDRRRILPVVVEGITYPVNPVTTEYIGIKLKERGLLNDARLLRLAVVDMGELEMLEGLRENRGIPIIDALRSWQTGPGWRFSLRNHLLETYGPGFLHFRPDRMTRTIDALTKESLERLKLSPPTEETRPQQ